MANYAIRNGEEMNQRSKYLFKNLGILTLSNFASKILVFLLVPLYTSVLTTTEYGTYDLVVSTTTLLFPVLTLNIVDAVMRFLMDKQCSRTEVVSIGIKFVLFSIGAISLLLLAISALNLFPSINGLKIYIFLYYTSYVLNQFMIQFAKGLEKVKHMGIAGALSTIVMLGANILFLLVFKMGLVGFFVANILAQFVPVVYFFFTLRFWKFIKRANYNKLLEKDMLVYCVPLICTALGWWVNSAADKYVVTLICGVAANGILSVSYKIPSIITTLQTIFTQAWQISAIKEYGEKDVASFYGKIFSYLNVIMCAACAWLIILSKPLAGLLYAKDFYVAWKYVPFLLISCVLNCASGFIGPILSAKKESKAMAMSAVYGAIVNVIMNIILVYLIGIQGATIATAISSLVIYFVRMKAVKKEMVIKDYAKVLITWGLLSIQALFEIYTTLVWAELIIMVVLLVINWTVLVEALTQLKKKNKKQVAN